MDYVGGEIGSSKIVHALIKTGMEGNFDTFGFDVKPQDVFGSLRKETKKDAFAGVNLQFA
jgi:hypothetical protein